MVINTRKILHTASELDMVSSISGDDLKLLQKTELEMFRVVNGICSENNVHLMLGGGTLLGAVRHKGFIPWDDDIDLMINRDEVNMFVNLMREYLPEKYELQYCHDEYEHLMSFIKIRNKKTHYVEIGHESLPNCDGVYLDVFIVENIPNNIIKSYFYGVCCNFLLFLGPSLLFHNYESQIERKMYMQSTKSKLLYLLRKNLGFCFSWRSTAEWYRIMHSFFSKYQDVNSKNVSIMTGRKHYFGEILPKKIFSDFILVDFEDIRAYVPVGYKDYLINLYGEDYMQVPPVDKREKHFVVEYNLKERLYD